MIQLRRSPRDVYRVYAEDEFFDRPGGEIFEWGDDEPFDLATDELFDREGTAEWLGTAPATAERRLRRLAGVAMLAGALGSVGGVLAVTGVAGVRGNPGTARGASRPRERHFLAAQALTSPVSFAVAKGFRSRRPWQGGNAAVGAHGRRLDRTPGYASVERTKVPRLMAPNSGVSSLGASSAGVARAGVSSAGDPAAATPAADRYVNSPGPQSPEFGFER